MLDNYSLEKEFRIYADIHKFRIVKGQLTTYYRDLDETGVTLPDFMRGATPEEKAEMMTSDLFCSNPVGFETTYNVAWGRTRKIFNLIRRNSACIIRRGVYAEGSRRLRWPAAY